MSPHLIGGFMDRSLRRRKIFNAFMCGCLGLAAVLALVPLLSIFSYVSIQGIPALNLDFFREAAKPVGESGGGMAHAWVGTLIMVAMASVMGIAWGILVGVFLSEFSRSQIATPVRFAVEILSSLPSILIGLFVYVMIVLPMHHFSALAGGIALGILMIPTIARTTEEMLKLVPTHVREAGLALGLPRWRVIVNIVLRGSLGGIVTGVMLAVARVAGETAPLLFTALGNSFMSFKIDQPMSALPMQIYTYAISPFEEWHRLAWGGAFILVVLVLCLNLATRVLVKLFMEKTLK